MNLYGEKVILRAIEKQDLPYLKKLMNDPENEKFVVGWSIPVSDSGQEEWFAKINKSNSTIRFAIELDKEFVGTCILSNIDWKNRNLGINIKILSEYKGRGIGKDTIITSIKYAFEELNMNRIEANILEYNVPSISLFEKCGFKKEGCKRKKIFKNNIYIDLLEYSILKDEYEERK